jgi:hypothetical protein
MTDDNDAAAREMLLGDEPSVVLTAAASYCKISIAMLALGPVMMVGTLVWGMVTNPMPEDWFVLIYSLLLITVVYLLVMPTKYEVMSDKAIRVHVAMPRVKYTFRNVARAYNAKDYKPGMFHLYIKFATDLRNKAAVERSNGRWTLLLSPKNVTEFVEAINSI